MINLHLLSDLFFIGWSFLFSTFSIQKNLDFDFILSNSPQILVNSPNNWWIHFNSMDQNRALLDQTRAELLELGRFWITGYFWIKKGHFWIKTSSRCTYSTSYYFIATILRNAHMCLYDGLTSSYFDCSAPSLEDYFRVEVD